MVFDNGLQREKHVDPLGFARKNRTLSKMLCQIQEGCEEAYEQIDKQMSVYDVCCLHHGKWEKTKAKCSCLNEYNDDPDSKTNDEDLFLRLTLHWSICSYASSEPSSIWHSILDKVLFFLAKTKGLRIFPFEDSYQKSRHHHKNDGIGSQSAYHHMRHHHTRPGNR